MSAVLEFAPHTAGRTTIDGAVYLPVNLLASSPTNPRKRFDPKTLDELADSIRKHSVLQPILVRERAGAQVGEPLYEIVAGERRWRASKLAEVDAIPAIDGAAVRAELASEGKAKVKKKAPATKVKAGANAKPVAKKAKAAPRASKVTTRYRNADTGETWSGRGLKPAWVRAALAGGRHLSDFDTKAVVAEAAPATAPTAAPASAVQLSSVAAWPFPKGSQ